MKITRCGHSCLLVETDGVKIITDPGIWNKLLDVTGLAAVLITHEHPDHFDVEKLKLLIDKNPNAKIITHEAVGAKLNSVGMSYEVIEPGQKIEVEGVAIESYGIDHAIIYGAVPPCVNTGYLIGEKLFVPGDALHDIPPKPVEVLALPTGGPWMKMSEAIEYAKKVNPKWVIPIHDAMYTDNYRTYVPRWLTPNLEPAGISFINLAPNESHEF